MLPAYSLTVGLAFLLIHEADAIRRHEWRLFYGLNRLPDDTGRLVFQWLHVPLYLAILYYVYLEPSEAFAFYFALFMVGHLGAHVALMRHPAYEFEGIESWTWIVGAALGGAGYLLGR